MTDQSNNPPPNAPQPATRTPLKSLGVGVLALILIAYLLNPTMGVDLIPDNLPIIGNLDDATATAMLLGCLSYFGINLPFLRPRR